MIECACPRKVRATDVTAIVHQGYLLGQQELEPSDPRRRLQPVRYEVLEFCQRPSCEKVFRADKKQEEA